MKNLRNHLAYSWWLYIVAAAAVIALWLSVFSQLAKPAANEQINITYIGSSFDHVKLQTRLTEILPGKTRQSIKSVFAESAYASGEYELNTLLRARSAGNCDFFIIESGVLEKYEIDLGSYFPEVEASAFERAFGNNNKVVKDGKIYGLELNGGMKISDYYSGTESCKIFFNKNSVNISDLFGGNAEQDAALQAILFLAEGKDV